MSGNSQLALSWDAGPSAGEIPEVASRASLRAHFALYSRSRARKDAFIDMIARDNPGCQVMYLCPRQIAPAARQRHPGAVVAAIEQFTHRETFLRLLSIAGPQTIVIMENVSRYALLSSDKFSCLQRLRMATTRRYLIDIAPFTQHVCKLYLPWSYLDREILRYSNGYAFQYNHGEMDAAGNIRFAHDFDLLAEKLAPHSAIEFDRFLPGITFQDSTVSAGEAARYAAYKEHLFAAYDNPRKIVTELCDCANMMGSRYESLAGVLEGETGHAVVYTNIVKNNPLIRQALRRMGVKRLPEIRTYMTHDCRPIEAEAVVLFETPINANRVAALDVLSDIAPGSRVYMMRNDTKADQLVFGETWAEWTAIDGLVRELWRVQCQGSI